MRKEGDDNDVRLIVPKKEIFHFWGVGSRI
jgi:hypothetical protein